ncbi:zf-HC2 domain-containing protein [Undibacterium sp.]|uniref:zf-HC2 domain-containing protein n=1 Tax=Undibacterium sp. TaxID=1914977 RepID=UPI002B785AE3|nr:zf-HC2 domain-containing protein [Undibacterium sp.]HTD02559.1 zf-HC2 domain-containing protein [Undibacterium sp.]
MLIRLTCKEAHRIVSEGLDRDLGLFERTRLRLHLGVCDACTNFNGQMQTIRQAMQKMQSQDPSSIEP